MTLTSVPFSSLHARLGSNAFILSGDTLAIAQLKGSLPGDSTADLRAISEFVQDHLAEVSHWVIPMQINHLIEKHNRHAEESTWVKIVHIFLLIVTFGLYNYKKSLHIDPIPDGLLIAKVPGYADRSFGLIGNPVEITEAMKAELDSLRDVIWPPTPNAAIEWHMGGISFTLQSTPNVVFKRLTPQEWDHFQERRLEEQTVCITNDLDLIQIPRFTLFEVNGIPYVAEDRLKASFERRREEWRELPGLNETVRQLAIFIAKTGLDRLPSLLDTDLSFAGPRRVLILF